MKNSHSVIRWTGFIGLLAGMAATTLPAPAQTLPDTGSFTIEPGERSNDNPTTQNRPVRNRNRQDRNRQNGSNDGTLPLPKGVDNVVSIDAFNMLLAETSDPATGENKDLTPFIIRHVYSGGIARLFGGSSMPTEEFLSPAFGQDGSGNGSSSTGALPNGGNFSGRSYGQGSNQGFNSGFNNGFNNGFNSGFNNNNGFNSYGNTGTGFNGFNGNNGGITGAFNMSPALNYAAPNFNNPNYGNQTVVRPNRRVNNPVIQPMP